MPVDYKEVRAKYKPKIFKTKKSIENGIWVPLSIAGYISGYSGQNLRLLCYQGIIKSGKFKVGPILVELGSILVYQEMVR